MKQDTIFFSCGDRSADNYLSLLLQKLSHLTDNVKFSVLAGEKSKPFAHVFLANVVDFDAHGFFSPFTQFYRFLKLYFIVKQYIRMEKPKLVVLLDFYGFNINIARIAKKLGCKVVYYITPQVWASRMNRVKKIKRYVDYVINILPFESKIFVEKGVNAFYFGHPMVELINFTTQKSNIIGLFPGSRKQVIKWNLPVMLKIVQFFLNNYSKEYEFVIFGFDKYEKLYKNIVQKFLSKNFRQYIKIQTSSDKRTEIVFALTVSGTVSLENVFYNIPMVVIYNLPWIMYFLLKRIVYVKHISLPNLILNDKVVPEFIKNKINIKEICDYMEAILSDNEERNKVLNRYSLIRKILGENKDVSLNVASKLLQSLS
ncbi:MAG: hypothetical protein N2555_03390 [Endomicrobia bacterium]|nr:hypothetical protein [Endomicrobiia bacterium]